MQLALAAKTNVEPDTYYRILHSSPAEIMSALFSPLVTASKIKKMPPTEKASRLQKYFRVKSKIVREDQVIIELLPTHFEVGASLPIHNFVRVTVDRSKDSAVQNQFIALVEVVDHFSFKSNVELKPHVSGSLMSFRIIDQGQSPKLLKLSAYTLKQLGFIYDSPEAAEKSD